MDCICGNAATTVQLTTTIYLFNVLDSHDLVPSCKNTHIVQTLGHDLNLTYQFEEDSLFGKPQLVWHCCDAPGFESDLTAFLERHGYLEFCHYRCPQTRWWLVWEHCKSCFSGNPSDGVIESVRLLQAHHPSKPASNEMALNCHVMRIGMI